MRFMIRFLVVVALVFCGWWALASYSVGQAIDGWAADASTQGLEVEAQTRQGGFPFNIRTTVDAVEVLDTSTQELVKASGAVISARTLWPGYVDIDLPETPMVFADPARLVSVQTEDGKAALRLRPGFALELGRATLDAAGWTVLLDQAPLVSGAALRLDADQTSEDRARYDIAVTAEALTPGNLPRRLLSLPANWPISFDAFQATGAVTFDAPLTRDHMEGPPPQFRQITLDDAQVIWGALSLNAKGALDVDAQGLPSGQITLQAKNWRGLLDLAQGSGALPAQQRGQVELVLGLLAGRAGDPANLDIDVLFVGGRMAVSGIPLGAAPRLLLR